MPRPKRRARIVPPEARVSAWHRLEAGLFRVLFFTGVWLVLAGIDLEDLPGLIIGVGGATLASFALMPPSSHRLRLLPALRLAIRFLAQSVIGGVEVGVRALHPRRPLKPCIQTYPSLLPPGPALNMLRALTSAVPGVIVCGSRPGGRIVVHCIDDDTPVDEALAMDEALLLGATGRARQTRG